MPSMPSNLVGVMDLPDSQCGLQLQSDLCRGEGGGSSLGKFFRREGTLIDLRDRPALAWFFKNAIVCQHRYRLSFTISAFPGRRSANTGHRPADIAVLAMPLKCANGLIGWVGQTAVAIHSWVGLTTREAPSRHVAIFRTKPYRFPKSGRQQ